VDRNLNINAELRTSTTDKSTGSFIEMDTSHASVNTTYQFAWKQC
jgi:hypothetical protein